MPVNSASFLGVNASFMEAMLQTATIDASKKCCSLREAPFSGMLHSAEMEDFNPDTRSGNLLKAWREHRKMTLAELAEEVGTTHSVIWLLESGERKLSPKWLYRLGAALKISPGWLLDHHPDDLPSDILELWGQIPEAQHQTVRDVLMAFKPFPKTGTEN
jgi:transcriptional regulator with XRE-family HTH domain